MDLKQLHYFTAVVEAGNISGAARLLHISQPPLSAQIHQLEEELGCLLFERGSRKITLTPAGKLFYERACTILSLCSSVQKELQDQLAGARGTLRLGAVSSVSSTAMIDWLASFYHAYPQIHLELSEGNTYQILEQLEAGLIELAIVRTPFVQHGLCCTYLQKEPLCAIGAQHYFQPFSHAPLSLSQLCTLPLILYRRWEQVLTELLRQQQLQASIFCKCDDARTVIRLAEEGLGVGVVPHSALSLLQNAQSVYRAIQNPALSSSIAIVHNPHAYLSAAGKAFLNHLTQYADITTE